MKAIILRLPCELDPAGVLVSQALTEKGYQTALTFLLERACASFADPVCPHNGRSHCGCRLAALRVSGFGETALALVLHQHAGETEVWLDAEEQAGDLALSEGVRQTLVGAFSSLCGLEAHDPLRFSHRQFSGVSGVRAGGTAPDERAGLVKSG